MKRHWIVVLLLLLPLAGACLLTGCRQYRQHQQELSRMEKLAADQALSYAAEVLGREAEVLSVEVGRRAVGQGAVPDTNALVTVSAGEEEFQVYVETAEPAFCRDNRDGLALARAAGDYFSRLYHLPPALELQVTLQCPGEGDFFGARPAGVARGYNFLSFDYRGQPLAEVLPLLESVSIRADYLADSVSLTGLELRAEDWAGMPEKLRVQLRAFRSYDPAADIPLGIQIDGDSPPVLMAEGMEFSRRGSSCGSLDDIAEALPAFALREALTWQNEEALYTGYTVTAMGDFWVSTREGLAAEDCFFLSADTPDWIHETDGIGTGLGAYYTREELQSGTGPAKSVQKTLSPFFDAQYRQAGALLLPREGAADRAAAWQSNQRKPKWDHTNLPPVQVMVRPSLVYGEKGQTGAGLLWGREGEKQRQVIQLFTSYQDQETRWTHALTNLTFYFFPGPVRGVALVRVE